MSLYFYPLVILLLCIAVPSSVVGYGDPIDLEIYDLVEEVGIQQSFYDVLQVDKVSASLLLSWNFLLTNFIFYFLFN